MSVSVSVCKYIKRERGFAIVYSCMYVCCLCVYLCSMYVLNGMYRFGAKVTMPAGMNNSSNC